MSEFKPRRCRECGTGTIRPLAKVPSTVAIPTCDHCGNEWINAETAEALDQVKVIRENLQISADTGADDEPIAVLLYTPDMTQLRDHHHIELTVAEAKETHVWVGAFLANHLTACDLCGDNVGPKSLHDRYHVTAPLSAELEAGTGLTLLTLRCYVPSCRRIVARMRVTLIETDD
jgi:hypothetical protein